MLETNYQRGCDTLYARWERVDKAGHELVLRNVEFTIDFWPNELNRYYGEGPGYAFEFFLASARRNIPIMPCSTVGT